MAVATCVTFFDVMTEKSGKLLVRIAQFSALADLQSLLGTCVRIRQSDVPCRKALRASITEDSVPHHLLIRFWLQASMDPYSESDPTVRPIFDRTELRCIREKVTKTGEHAVGVVGEIYRDVNRTFPWHPMFYDNEEGQHAMFDALRAYASVHIDVGYCQGMNYIVGFLISCQNYCWTPGNPLSPHTAEACSTLLSHLSHSYGMRDVWKPGVVRIRLMAFQLQYFVKKLFPLLHNHFKEYDISCEMLCVQWFLPLLTSALPFHTSKRILQLFITEGWKVMYRTVTAILRRFNALLHAPHSRANFQSFLREWRSASAYDREYSAVKHCDDGTIIHHSNGEIEGGMCAVETTVTTEPLYLLHHPDALIAAMRAEKAITNRKLAELEKQFALLALRKRIDCLPGDGATPQTQGRPRRSSQESLLNLPLLAPQVKVCRILDRFYVPSPRQAGRQHLSPHHHPHPRRRRVQHYPSSGASIDKATITELSEAAMQDAESVEHVEHSGKSNTPAQKFLTAFKSMFVGVRPSSPTLQSTDVATAGITGVKPLVKESVKPPPVLTAQLKSITRTKRLPMFRRFSVDGGSKVDHSSESVAVNGSAGEQECCGTETDPVKNATILSSVGGKTLPTTEPFALSAAAAASLSPLSTKIIELKASLDGMSEPERDDFAVLSSKIECITRQLPKLREKVTESQSELDAAALVMERVLKMKQELLGQHHESVLKTPLTARARRRTSSVGSTGSVFGEESTHTSPAVSAPSSGNTSPNHAVNCPSVFDPECGVTLGDAIDHHVTQATLAQAVRTKETMEKLNHLTQQLKRTEGKVQTAVTEWRKCHWEHTMLVTELEELEQHKHSLQSQLTQLIELSEQRKERAMVDAWKSLATLLHS